MIKFILIFLSGVFTCSLWSQNFAENMEYNSHITFKENKGQISDQNFKARPDILFSGTDGQLDFYLRSNGISYQLNRVDSWTTEKELFDHPTDRRKSERAVPAQRTTYRIDINWLNTSLNQKVEKGESLPGYENYYGETCPDGALNVKNYKEILYKNLYPGIDLKWFESKGALKYDYYVSANANYKQIQFEFEGAEKIYVTKKGELIIETPLGNILEQKPVVKQGTKTLEANWIVKNNIVSFDIKNVDPARALIIDPMVRLWGTYYGGADDDYAYSIKTDNLGNVCICGETGSNSNIATTGAHQTVYGGAGNYWGDAFIAKFDPAGLRLWATYYGGAQNDFANDCAFDANGDVYMVGGTSTTNSAVMATAGSHQSAAPGSTISNTTINDAFLVKFNSSGIRQWGTYYGGNSYEWAYFVNVNAFGDILISGTTNSTDGNSIATSGCHQPVYGGGVTDGFIAKFDLLGVRQWGTYYGGSSANQEDVTWCSFDLNGDIYISGYTSSTNGISTPGSHQPVFGGVFDGFLVKFNSTGVRQWGTYFGGASNDYFGEGDLDAAGNIYLTGDTRSANAISTPGCHQFTFGGGNLEDGFLVKFNPSGVVQWSTYYGGAGREYASTTSVDPFGNIYFSGFSGTISGTAIATTCAYQSLNGGGSSDNFLVKFTPSGTRIWGTYFGGIFTDESGGCAADLHGNVYLLGVTYAGSGTVMATPGAHQAVYGGMIDSFLEKFDGCVAGSPVNTTPASNLLVCTGHSATLSATCGNWYNSATGSTPFATGDTFTSGAITSDSTFYVEDFGCGSVAGTRTAINVTVVPNPTLTITNNHPVACVGESVILSASGASSYTWSNNSATTSTLQVNVFLNTTYTVVGADANGCTATTSIAIDPNLCLGTDERIKMNRSVRVFPNPSRGSFIIQADHELGLLLTDQLGQIISHIRLTPENNFQLLLSDLASGVYFLNTERSDPGLNKKIVVIGSR